MSVLAKNLGRFADNCVYRNYKHYKKREYFVLGCDDGKSVSFRDVSKKHIAYVFRSLEKDKQTAKFYAERYRKMEYIVPNLRQILTRPFALISLQKVPFRATL
jgi:hypothetical protein